MKRFINRRVIAAILLIGFGFVTAQPAIVTTGVSVITSHFVEQNQAAK